MTKQMSRQQFLRAGALGLAGMVVVPATLAPALLRAASAHAEWEDFTRLRLAEGGDLRTYYPLSEAARAEYEASRCRSTPRSPSSGDAANWQRG